uniref:Uncharacterized protein n=1 Tax=Rhodnius prolixus TaxID=13249 RepID=T1HCM0_RHOPR
MVKLCSDATDKVNSIHRVLPDDTIVLATPSIADGSSHHSATSGPLANIQNVSLSEDLFISDDSSDVYNPSHSEESSSGYEEIENAQDIREVEDLIAVNNSESRILNKKGRGRNKLAEKDKTRKRKRNPSGWERNRRHEARSKGDPYFSTSKKYVPGKALKDACTCKRKCREKLSEEMRLQIFQDFMHWILTLRISFLHRALKKSKRKWNGFVRIKNQVSDDLLCYIFCIIAKGIKFKKVFVEKFNLSFHHPSNDTCAKCDKYKIQINACTDLQEKAVLEESYTQHLALADQAYNVKKEDKSQSFDNGDVAFLSFDLQKCLPTPMLQNNISFYKRCLWTFNLTVYSCVSKKKQALCYIWDESIGGRGGQEIASCLRQYILTLPTNVSEINIFSDCCTGQTRNIYLTAMFSLIIENCSKNGRKLVINHKFLEPGHTHLEADTIHAAIEKVKKNTTAKIEIPRDWANLIRLVPRKPPIEVIEMKQTDLLNFENLLKSHYVHRKLNSEKERINWFQIKWLQYSTLTPTKVSFKNSFSSSEPFKILDLARKNISNETYSTRSSTLTRVKMIETPTLIPINKNRIPLPEKKMKDLKDLMPFLSESSRSFYEPLILGPTVPLEDEYLPDERED